jgi:hypothetical protein
METVRKVEILPFEIAITRGDRRRPKGEQGKPSRVFSYLQRGRYAHQVAALLGLFPASQIRFVRTDELWSSQSQVLADLFDWLGLVPEFSLPRRSEYIAPMPSRQLGPPDPATMVRLTADFAEDILETARLTGYDLSDWLSPDYVEPIGT